METILHIDEKDNLVTCLRDVKKGETVEVEGEKITANADIPQFHKMAAADIEKGGLCYSTRRPSARIKIEWPSRKVNLSTCGLMLVRTASEASRRAIWISLSKWPMLQTMA